MKVKCNYCDSMIDAQAEQCPNCGAVNENMVRTGNGVPKTIQELKEWAKAHNLPLEKMRFFIGEDYREPRAFGIYEKSPGYFVVYKNKGNGERAIRYEGKDEAYAVNELYMKMKSEIANQKSRTAGQNKNGKNSRKKTTGKLQGIIFLVIFAVLALAQIFGYVFSAKRGYYSYNGNTYYRCGSTWYGWDDSYNMWTYAYDLDDEFTDNYSDYYEGKSYDSSNDYTDFEDTYYYEEWSSSSDWDSDSTWDSSDSWDSGGTDWDSDW